MYISDEREGIKYANQFADRGFNNIYLLSGGFDEFVGRFPQYVEGRKAAMYQGKMIIKSPSPKKDPVIAPPIGKPIPKEVTGKVTDTNETIWGKGQLSSVKPRELTGKITGECHLDKPKPL